MPGGAQELVEAGVMDGVDLVVGAHLFSLDELGKVGVLRGPHTAAADLFTIEIRGKGGHGAAPHEAVDPVTAAAQVISGLQHVVSRVVDPIERAVVSVCMVHGGTAGNIIPEVVELGGTVRTFSPEVRDKVRDAMERFAQGIAEAHGATCHARIRGGLRVRRQRRAGVRPRRGGGPRGARRRGVLRTRADHGRRGLLRVPSSGTPGAFFIVGRAGRGTSRTTIRASIGTRAQ